MFQGLWAALYTQILKINVLSYHPCLYIQNEESFLKLISHIKIKKIISLESEKQNPTKLQIYL